MTVTTAKFTKSMPGLDGLRGLAILLVLVYHFGFALPAGLLRRLCDAGWCGVDLFFALSGFLITGILLDTQRATNYFSGFYARRALRILPLFYLLLAACLALGIPLAGAYWLQLANWIPRSKQSPVLLHLWSLAVEEQFYVFWPLLLWRRTLRQVMALALGTALMSFCARWAIGSSDTWRSYEWTLCRLDGFAAGAFVAAAVRDEIWLQRVARSWKAAAALAFVGCAAVVVRAHALGPYSGPMSLVGYSMLAIGFSALVAGCAIEDHLATSSLLTSFGKYSYAIYVVHFPLSVALEPYNRTESMPVAGVWFVGSIAASWLLGVVSWYALERYPLRLKQYFRPRFGSQRTRSWTPDLVQ